MIIGKKSDECYCQQLEICALCIEDAIADVPLLKTKKDLS